MSASSWEWDKQTVIIKILNNPMTYINYYIMITSSAVIIISANRAV